MSYLVDKTLTEIKKILQPPEVLRIIWVDGSPQYIDIDYQPNRINVAVMTNNNGEWMVIEYFGRY